MMLSMFARGAKEPMPKSASALPMSKVKSDSSWGGKNTYNGNSFINFQDTRTFCGNKQRLFVLNPTASDYQPMTNFDGSIFRNVAFDNMVFLYDPPRGWANMNDCGNFPCTAPNNVILSFTRTNFDVMLSSLIRNRKF
jgi:hypothetical protein